MILSLIIFWLICSYVSFAGSLTYYVTEYHCVSDMRWFCFIMSLGGPIALLSGFLALGFFKHGLNWYKALQIDKAIQQSEDIKRGGV